MLKVTSLDMDNEKTKKKLENQIKVLKMKLKKAKLEQEAIFTEAFSIGFDEGRAYQINEMELDLYEQEGEAH